MAPSRRTVVIAAAAVVSAPGVLVAAAACIYILHSLATDAWYREWFVRYGTTMAALYVFFVAGVVAAACVATRNTRSALALSLATAGFAAACALDFELHDEAERVLPFGLLFGPYVAWALAWLALRSPPAAPVAPQ